MLTRQNISISDVFIKTFASLTEPSGNLWFQSRASTGRIIFITWSFSSLILNLAYNCTLRANLLKKSLEKPINNIDDIIERGEKLYLPAFVPDRRNLTVLSKWYFKTLHQSVKAYGDTPESVVPMEEDRSINDRIFKDILTNGSSYMQELGAFLRQADKDPVKMQKLRVGTQNAMVTNTYRCFLLAKFRPWREDFDKAVLKIWENGLLRMFQKQPHGNFLIIYLLCF